ncbi:flagellar protein FliT [Citrobacter amalonaticus]|uniref:flagellar protein FliT n=1 Tax=Citrobacter amalonaticus TaxID=35703 RepID=UPI001906A793|nr:flagellar protein FliT [Citrobacter amalonaticus]MBJ9260457.1 flagellar protein FliT [Citrobacter amalonaticus]
MEGQNQQQQLFALIDAMNDSLDKQRWRRMPALHQQLMRLFEAYAATETSTAELQAVKARLHAAYSALIERQMQRAEALKARMDSHQQHQEGVLAYSMVNSISEKA